MLLSGGAGGRMGLTARGPRGVASLAVAAEAARLAKRARHQNRLGPVPADPEDDDRVVRERVSCEHQDLLGRHAGSVWVDR